MGENLIQGLMSEMNRVRNIITEYRDPSLKGAGELSARLMEIDIKKAEKAISTGDTIAMMTIYTTLKEYEP